LLPEIVDRVAEAIYLPSLRARRDPTGIRDGLLLELPAGAAVLSWLLFRWSKQLVIALVGGLVQWW
jgi:hypothetical protein